MDFDVKMDDVDAAGAWIGSYVSQVGAQIDSIQAAALGIASLEGFQGAAADSVKSYWGEVHLSVLAALSAALSEVLARYALYMGNYSSVDGSKSARFESSALTAAYAVCSSSRTDFSGKLSALSAAVGGVSDLVGGWAPSGAGVDGALADLAEKARWLRDRVGEHEGWHASDAAGCDALISSARQLVSSLGSGSGGGVSYAPGSIASAPGFAALAAAFDASCSYVSAHADGVEAAYAALAQRMRQREEERVAREAEEREQKGWIELGTALIAMIVGGAAIVFTAGAATPVVVGAVCVVGAFQASNVAEGAQDIYYGSIGDVTTLAFNPLRDTLFCGNQQAYDGAQFVLTTVAALAVPASAAVGAARATGASVSKCVGTAAKSAAIGAGRDFVTEVGLTATADRVVDGTLGKGVAGALAKEALHQGAGLLGTKVHGRAEPPAPRPGGGPGSAASPLRLEGVELPESFSKGPFKPGELQSGIDLGSRMHFGSGGREGEVGNIKRPSWRQSELDVGDLYAEHEPQKSFLNGEEVPYGTKGSTRPDFYKLGSSIEVKNYDVTTDSGRSSLIHAVSKQINQRTAHLPQGSIQTIIIDVRGQEVTNTTLRELRNSIMQKCDSNATIQFMR